MNKITEQRANLSRQDATSEIQDDGMLDLFGLARTLWRGKWWILTSMLTAMLVGGTYVYVLATPEFRATSVVMLESRQESIAGLDSVLGDLATNDTPVVNTEVEVLRGRKLMGVVVEELDLIADPEFNRALRPLSNLARLRTLLRPPSPEPAPEPDVVARAQAERDATISTLLNQVSITNVPSSLVFQITATSTSRGRAAEIADAIANAYIGDQLRVRMEATQRASSWLAERVAELRSELEAAERAVRMFQGETEVTDTETLAVMDRRLKEMRSRRDEVRAEERAIAEQIAIATGTDSATDQAQGLGSSRLEALAAAGLDDDARRVEFERIKNDLLLQLRRDHARLEAQVTSLNTATEQLAENFEQQSRQLIELEQLEREAESSRLLYEHFQTRLKETSVQVGIQQADSRILSEAVIPGAPATPQKTLIIAMSAVLGMMICMLVLVLRELQSQSLRTAADLEAFTGCGVLAQIPKIPGKTRQASLNYLAQNPTSPPAEAVRNLRTSLLLSSPTRPPQVIMMTSSLPGEGKTTLTMAMAQNLTSMGQRVLMIEGDIRKHALTDCFPDSAEEDGGLISVIEGKLSLPEAVRHIPNQGDILPATSTSVEAIDLFASKMFSDLVKKAREEYDMILIDTPPVLSVPDARMIAQHADAVVFMVRWDDTRREHVRDALRQLDMVNIYPTGLVLSHFSPEGMRRYGYGYGYGYGY